MAAETGGKLSILPLTPLLLPSTRSPPPFLLLLSHCRANSSHRLAWSTHARTASFHSLPLPPHDVFSNSAGASLVCYNDARHCSGVCKSDCVLLSALLRISLKFAADIISAVEFSHDGEYLATGDKGGRCVLFERNQEEVGRVIVFAFTRRLASGIAMA